MKFHLPLVVKKKTTFLNKYCCRKSFQLEDFSEIYYLTLGGKLGFLWMPLRYCLFMTKIVIIFGVDLRLLGVVETSHTEKS